MLQEKVYPEVFEAEFKSVTPWWGGGPYGTVKLPDNSYWYPSSETIVGKTKWFARALKWTCSQNQGLNHGVLERDMRELFGYAKSSEELLAPSTFSLELIPNVKDEPKEEDELIGENPKVVVPRVVLGFIGREFLDHYDAPVGDIHFTTKVRAAPKALGGSPEGAKRFVASMLLTLAYAGIGRAANRGFGRFYLNSETLKAEGMADISNLAKLIEEGKAKDAFNYGLKIIFGEDLEKCVNNIVEVKDCPGKTTKDILKVLEIIGNSFLYKEYKEQKELKEEDVYKMASFGLPRRHLTAEVEVFNRNERSKIFKVQRAQSPIIASPIIVQNSDIKVLLITLNSSYLFDLKLYLTHSRSEPKKLKLEYFEMMRKKLALKLDEMCRGGAK